MLQIKINIFLRFLKDSTNNIGFLYSRSSRGTETVRGPQFPWIPQGARREGSSIRNEKEAVKKAAYRLLYMCINVKPMRSEVGLYVSSHNKIMGSN